MIFDGNKYQSLRTVALRNYLQRISRRRCYASGFARRTVALRNYLQRIAKDDAAALLCWDAPLTGPFDIANPGTNDGDFTKRPIERFFSSRKGIKVPKGISVLGYGACPHWTISRSLLGLPRVGEFDIPEAQLPFRLITHPDHVAADDPSVVEIHPALAAWLWCCKERPAAAWIYKGNKTTAIERTQVQNEMWNIIREKSEVLEEEHYPDTDDKFDAAIGYALGKMLVGKKVDQPGGCMILGDGEHGAFLLPFHEEVLHEWNRWKEGAL